MTKAKCVLKENYEMYTVRVSAKYGRLFLNDKECVYLHAESRTNRGLIKHECREVVTVPFFGGSAKFKRLVDEEIIAMRDEIVRRIDRDKSDQHITDGLTESLLKGESL